jgi:hypothetical protein
VICNSIQSCCHYLDRQLRFDRIQFSKEWLKENATAELVENAYNYLPQSEKEKFLATILSSSSQNQIDHVNLV